MTSHVFVLINKLKSYSASTLTSKIVVVFINNTNIKLE